LSSVVRTRGLSIGTFCPITTQYPRSLPHRLLATPPTGRSLGLPLAPLADYFAHFLLHQQIH
jgi:hypothetical protein